jgi:hypothetical protein
MLHDNRLGNYVSLIFEDVDETTKRVYKRKSAVAKGKKKNNINI